MPGREPIAVHIDHLWRNRNAIVVPRAYASAFLAVAVACSLLARRFASR